MRGAWQREPEDPRSEPLVSNLAESTVSVPAFQVIILNPLPTKHGYTHAHPKASHILPETPKTFHTHTPRHPRMQADSTVHAN